jgi:hypothetical protein
MKSMRKFVLIAIIVINSIFFLSVALTSAADEDVNHIFTAAESLFQSMKGKNYLAIWQCLTTKTQQSIVDAIYKASKKRGAEINKSKIIADFSEGGRLAKTYWDSYLNVFDVNLVLEQSKWDIGSIKEETAEIIILYKKSANPTLLQLHKENNVWKVGLEETFGARDLLSL